MDELDLLKKDWQRQEKSFPKIQSDEIYVMIHKKSSSIVRWIFIISVFEFLFWIILSLITNNDTLYQEIEDFYYFETAISVLYWIILVVFIVLFYKNFKKISNTSSVKPLMQNILRVRKIVNMYVWYNIGMFIFISIAVLVLIYTQDQSFLFYSDDKNYSKNLIFWMLITTFTIVFLAIAVAILWLFYRLLYGILLKRLQTNYKSLSELEI